MSAGTVEQRLMAGAVALAAWLVCRLPAGPVERVFDLAGAGHYLLDRRRRDLVRRNLRRVCEVLAADGRASPRVAAAARQPRALEGLVRDAFRHHARYYFELMRIPVMNEAWLRDHFRVEDPEIVERAFARVAAGGSMIVVGLHFGAVEVPAIYSAGRLGRDVAGPMEVVANPALQDWFVRQRERIGVRIVTPLAAAPAELRRVIAGGGVVGVVADRDVTGGGRAISLFGAPAPLPVGPALLAVQSGAAVFAVSCRRAGGGRYVGRLLAVEVPRDGPLRERVERFLAHEAKAFETLIAEAPEQWWATLFPIWPEAPGRQAEAGASDRAGVAA